MSPRKNCSTNCSHELLGLRLVVQDDRSLNRRTPYRRVDVPVLLRSNIRLLKARLYTLSEVSKSPGKEHR
jgi:hypothetical protein